MVPIIIVVVLAVLLPVLWWIGMRNGFVRKSNQCRQAYATIDVQLKKRHDLVPNLVSSIKGIMKHEKELFTEIVAARSQASALAAGTDDISQAGDRSAAEGRMAAGLGHLFALAEDYPEVRSSSNFLYFQKTLVEIESQIAAARRAYNSAATTFNNAREMFPSSIVGNSMNLDRIDLFEAIEIERSALEVTFDG